MLQTKKLARRELLRSGGLAALAAAGASVIPLAARATGPASAPPVKSATADAKVMSLGERCLSLACETKRLHGIFSDAADKQEEAFAATGMPRWRSDTPIGRNIRQKGGTWEVFAKDMAPDWYAFQMGGE